MENVIVTIVVLAAAVFFGWSVFKKIKAFKRASSPGASPCECCGGCKGGSCASKRLGEKLSGLTDKKAGKKSFAVAAMALAMSLMGPTAFAADTTEAYGPGEISFEAHQSFEGFRDGREGLTVGHESLIGLGIHKYLSAQIGFSFGANGYLGDADAGVSFTLLSTVLDTDKFDLDLWLSVDGGITPGLELNFDFLENLGVYLRAEVPLAGVVKGLTSDGENDWETTVGLSLVPGIVWTVKENHQLLLEAGFELLWSDAADASGKLDLWSVALGYNFMITEKIEIVTEVKTFHPDGGDQEFGIGFGVIASL